jgi:chorismate mutase
VSIRFIARDLYRLQQDVEKLEESLKTSSTKDIDGIENRLLQLRAERNHLRAVLEAKKERPPYRQPK